jgi:outer membrane lipoprotein-sorting protein
VTPAAARAVSAVVIAGAFCVSPASGQEDGQTRLEAAAERYGQASTLCADFVQVRAVPLLRQEVTQRGRLCSADPNLFAMRFTDPEGNVIVSDGTTQWIYRPSDNPNQVFRATIGPETGGQDFYREVLEDPGSKYQITCASREDLDGHPTFRLCLRSKTVTRDRPDLVWIDAETDVVRQLHFTEENGSERTITLSDIQFDVRPPDGWFSFTPPSGAVVIEM